MNIETNDKEEQELSTMVQEHAQHATGATGSPAVPARPTSPTPAPGRTRAERVAERDRLIVHGIVVDGRTLIDVGNEHGMTRERVRQIVAEHEPGFPEERRRQQALRREAGSTTRKTEQSREKARVAVARTSSPQARLYSDEDLLQALRDWTAAHGRPPSTNLWEGRPTIATFIKRFGSWARAKELAGVGDGGTIARTRKWSDTMVVEFVLEFLLSDPTRSTDRFGSASYSRWRAAARPEAPSLSTIILQTAAWSDVKRRAILLGESRGQFPVRADG